MKKIKIALLNRINLLIGTLIALLGVGCKHNKVATNSVKDDKITKTQTQGADAQDEKIVNPMREEMLVCKYGVPRAEVALTGVVRDKNGKPMADIIVEALDKHENMIDMTRTDGEGRYTIIRSIFPVDSIIISISDELDRIEPQEKAFPLEYKNEIDEWERGNAAITFDFIVVPKRIDRPKKYGVPYRPKPEETK
ncbi:MAG: carboxypeptidase regulatory-like domain-containing protein [Paludibacteraceae bacterium]|nr:carboxypeptidase regulatory-like domain-containing protein [Paludibacteraceae bacterium]